MIHEVLLCILFSVEDDAVVIEDVADESSDDDNAGGSDENKPKTSADNKGRSTFFPGHFTFLPEGHAIRSEWTRCMNSKRREEEAAPYHKTNNDYLRHGRVVEQCANPVMRQELESELGVKGRPVFHRLNEFFSVIDHIINDFMHLLYNIILLIFGWMIRGNFGKGRQDRHKVENRKFIDEYNEYVEVNEYYKLKKRWPWQASNESIELVHRYSILRPTPGKISCSIGAPFGFDKSGPTLDVRGSADWIHMIGPVGVFYIYQLDLHPTYQAAFSSLLWCLYELRARKITKDRLKEDDPHGLPVRIQEALARLEYLMPNNFLTILLHLVQHICAVIRFTGPVHGTWMFTFERWIKRAKRVLHSGYSAAEGVMKNMMLERWTILNRYKTKAQLDELLTPPLDHLPVNETPNITRSYVLVGKAVPKKFVYSANPKRPNTFRLIYVWLLQNDPLFMAINKVYKSVVPESYYTGGVESIDVWLTTKYFKPDVHFSLVQAAAKQVGVTINTIDELATILRGPVHYASYKRFRINDAEFCNSEWEDRPSGTRSTTRRCIKYRLTDPTMREFDFGFGYAMIEGIYEFRSHELLGSSTVYELLQIHNYARKTKQKWSKKDSRYEVHPSQLTRVTRASQENNTYKHSSIITMKQVSAFNVAFWPDGATRNYFVVHTYVDPDILPYQQQHVAEQRNDSRNDKDDEEEEQGEEEEEVEEEEVEEEEVEEEGEENIDEEAVEEEESDDEAKESDLDIRSNGEENSEDEDDEHDEEDEDEEDDPEEEESNENEEEDESIWHEIDDDVAQSEPSVVVQDDEDGIWEEPDDFQDEASVEVAEEMAHEPEQKYDE